MGCLRDELTKQLGDELKDADRYSCVPFRFLKKFGTVAGRAASGSGTTARVDVLATVADSYACSPVDDKQGSRLERLHGVAGRSEVLKWPGPGKWQGSGTFITQLSWPNASASRVSATVGARSCKPGPAAHNTSPNSPKVCHTIQKIAHTQLPI